MAYGFALAPANWSLYLDPPDVRAEQRDFTAAVRPIDQGTKYEPDELSLRGAGAAYRARLTGSPAELSERIGLRRICRTTRTGTC